MAKYEPFKQMTADLADKPGVTNPAGLSAFIAAKKYGRPALQQAAATGHSLRHAKPLHKKGKHHAQIARFVKRHHKGN